MSNVKIYSSIRSYERLAHLYDSGELDDLFSSIRHTVRPGDHVVLKPNFVKESHMERPDEWIQIVTNGELIRCALDSVAQSLGGSGRISVIDAPQTDSDYDRIVQRVRLPEIISDIRNKYSGLDIEHFDIREERWFYRDGIITSKRKLPGDPLGYTEVDLGTDSFFTDKPNKEYYGADYDRSETSRYHDEKHNIYVMSNTVLDADVFINLPKLKTHKLGGMTCCLKNIVGACVIKNSLPHYTLGSPDDQGDQFEGSSEKTKAEGHLKVLAGSILKHKIPLINYPFIALKKIAGVFLGSTLSETVRNGSWYGNDTIWRTTLDLNRILLYADKQGKMRDVPQRRYLAFVDAIVAGEGNGPMAADSKDCGVLIAGDNPVEVDFACARLMGFDWEKIPTVRHGFDDMRWRLVSRQPYEVTISSNDARWNKLVLDIDAGDTLGFHPHFGWRGHVELS